jgi:hydrogenase/urease accessory protein HupE
MSALRTALVLVVALLLVWLALVSATLAHESRPAYLEIEETSPGQYTVLWRTPMIADRRLPIVLRFPEGVRNTREPIVQRLSDSLLERRWIDAGHDGLAGQRIDFHGLELTITEAVVVAKLLDGRSRMAIARPSQPWVEIEPSSGIWATLTDFLRQGFEHILSGPDHLLFVFGLLLLARSPWMLVKTITAFTVAHSLTLAAATLGYVNLPAAPIEILIALSIVFLGAEIVRALQGATSVAIRNPWALAFAFGLLHGFGFAGVLSAAGLPPGRVPLALVSFNIGVEIGQLAFVALIALVGFAVRQVGIAWPRRAGLVPAYVVGSLGAFWLLQRISLL